MVDFKNIAVIISVMAIGAGGLVMLNSAPSSPIEASPQVADIMRYTAPYGAQQNAFEPSAVKSIFGAYLASQFAQRRQDWDNAAGYLDALRIMRPSDIDVLKKAIVLEMGAGNPQAALAAAQDLLDLKEEADLSSRALAALFLVTEAFAQEDYASARERLIHMPSGSFTDFMLPLLYSWLSAAEGTLDIAHLDRHAVQVLHAAYIADFLDNDHLVGDLLDRLSRVQDMPLPALERLADFNATLDRTSIAQRLYLEYLQYVPSSDRVVNKLRRFDPALSLYKTAASPRAGLARAYYDMGYILQKDGADDSAQIFVAIALFLDKNLDEAYMLDAQIAEKADRLDDAVTAYFNIPQGSPYFIQARRQAANLYADMGAPERAIAVLQSLYNYAASIDALIQIGDIHRQQEDYTAALEAYNHAANQLGGTIPPQHWYLHYVRGIAQEQIGNWLEAEADLRQALAIQPEHPFVLNYLGYAMADRGQDLDAALNMIQRAVDKRPEDGYITDSLGWVYYKLGEYAKAVPHLELAVELLPADPIVNDHLGDAYWQVGRRIEARYQWLRARNHRDIDAEHRAALTAKIKDGLTTDTPHDIITTHNIRASED